MASDKSFRPTKLRKNRYKHAKKEYNYTKFMKLKQRFRYPSILLKELVKTDFKLRYQGSVLGYIWSLLRPLAIFGILYVVFVRFLNVGRDIENFPVYLLLGIVLWNYFIEVTTGSVSAIVAKGDLMRKINFPRYVLVLASSFSALINLTLNLIVIFIFILATGIEVRFSIIWLPLIILQLFVFSLAIAFFLSAAFVRYRDVGYIWDVIVQGAFYATPIIYPLNKVPGESTRQLLMLNPMAQIVQDARYVTITKQTLTYESVYSSQLYRVIPIVVTVGTVIVAGLYFRSRSKHFAEEV